MATRRLRESSNPVGDFLTFRLMITPVLIQIIFWIGTLACFGVGGRMVAASFDAGVSTSRDFDRESDRVPPSAEKLKKSSSNNFSVYVFAQGLMIMFGGPLLVRIACELDIILFSIHAELKEANNRERDRPRD